MNAPTIPEAVIKGEDALVIKNATHYLKRSNTYSPVDPANLIVVDELPVGTYTVGLAPDGYYFERIEDFELSHKLYGDISKNAARILNTFQSRPNATGVLLEGEKGSGKSMLLKKISIEARKLGMPTIVINSAFCGDNFNAFIQNLKQPAMIAFDEFEKIYDSDDQERLLTILDGTFPSKKLFVLTVNNKWRIDSHMRNRPGRIFYSMSFGGLDNAFISEYCADNLKNQDHASGVLAVASHLGTFTFDMLKALVEEMNRYGENASDAMKWLNINPEDSDDTYYDIDVLIDGKSVGDDMNYVTSQAAYYGNPLTVDDWTFFLTYGERQADGAFKHSKQTQIDLFNEEIESFNPNKGSYTFKVRGVGNENLRVVLTRKAFSKRTYAY